MAWPAHLAHDVRFDHAAAATAADELRRLAALLDRHAEDRSRQMAHATHFEGGTRIDVERLEQQLAGRAQDLVARLRAEAADVEGDAATARSAASTLAQRRDAWLAQQRRERERAARAAAERAQGHGR